MSRLVMILAAAVMVWFATSAWSQSLGDLARKEKERRDNVKSNEKVITNNEVGRYRAGSVTTGSLPKPVAAPEANRAAAASAEKTDEPTDFEGRPESYWRQTLADARKRVADLENEANVLTLKIADLQNQFYRESDGFRQQTIQRDVQKAFYEQDLNKENLARAKQSLQALEIEARKSGALPGWIEPRPEERKPPE